MEEILDIYAETYTQDCPLICMDEAAKQLLRDERAPLPMRPGTPRREDYHYERRGTAAIFLFFDPHRGWRRSSVRDSRTRYDWAEEVKRLLDEDYPHAKLVTLVCDNLNTHGLASLYEAFAAPEARRLARRLNIRHTPRHGSWLNMAEIELSAMSRQCLKQRVGSSAALAAALTHWDARRNAEKATVRWKFTVDDARTTLSGVYPSN